MRHNLAHREFGERVKMLSQKTRGKPPAAAAYRIENVIISYSISKSDRYSATYAATFYPPSKELYRRGKAVLLCEHVQIILGTDDFVNNLYAHRCPYR